MAEKIVALLEGEAKTVDGSTDQTMASENPAANLKTILDIGWKIGIIALALAHTYWSSESNSKELGSLNGRLEKVQEDVRRIDKEYGVTKSVVESMQKWRESEEVLRMQQDNRYNKR